MSNQSQDSAGNKPWTLAPLTPKYLEAEHGNYVKAINNAIENPNIRNIALSGNFGVGKSSILKKVAESNGNRVVELSLSTLSPVQESNQDNDQESSPDDEVATQATTPTNLIQREIVKQLLYREKPNKTPGSRFQRIERFRWWRELGIATLVGFVIAMIFLLAGWTEQVRTELTPMINFGLWAHLIVLCLATVMTISARYLFHGRIHIRQLSAGSATITLDDKSVSYFDQYLDEIVYFFEVSQRDIVIFEDIDRFNDSRIFETLQSLNTLLNASSQTDDGKGKPIRFIYAIKDSIFDQIGLDREGRKIDQDFQSIQDPAQAEAVRANRTKFFDLVIPVVPFITHRSARNLAHQLLSEINQDIDVALIDLAARYIPDMRLLKNVRNEFIVFRDRIFSGVGAQLNLTETHLFAMILYKSTHLTDFEAIRIGKSKLDELYDAQRELVRTNIRLIEREERVTRQHLKHLNGVTSNSDQLGKELIAHVKRTARAAGIGELNVQLSFNGKSRSENDLERVEFWREFAGAKGDPKLELQHPGPNPRLRFLRSDIEAALGIRLEPENWDEANREELNATLAQHLDNLSFLKSADIADLIHKPDFLVTYKGSERSLDAIIRELFPTGLAYHLLRSRYITENFTLYTSTFHGDRVSPAAMNFIIHHVQRNVMDEYFELDKKDAAAVVRENGRSSLSEPALYNIAILDYLLESDVDSAKTMIKSLKSLGDDQKRFMQAYLNNGSKCRQFIEHFVAVSTQFLVYLVSQVELEEQSRLEFLDTALANLAQKMKYQTDSALSAYLKDHYAELTTLTSASLEGSAAKQIGKVFSEAGIRIPTLAPLSETVRQVFIAQNLYEINQENLAIALGNQTSLSLDTALATDEDIYNYLLKYLDDYLLAIDEDSATVDSDVLFIKVIEDVLSVDADKFSVVIANASNNCVVNDLEQVPKDAWPHLARGERIPATFNNVTCYLHSTGSLDGNLAMVLSSAEAITEHENYEEDAKLWLAKNILTARKSLPSAALRAKLASSLELQSRLDVSEIFPENSELFALLLKHDLIEDDAEAYVHLAQTDWPTRERFIQESTEFQEYMSPELVQGDLGALLLSNKVDSSIKTEVIKHAGEYVEGSSSDDLAELARFANQHGNQLRLDTVEELARKGVPAEEVVILLRPHLGTESSDQLFRILNSLGGKYSMLASVGRERPRISSTPANRALLEALKQHDIVTSYKDNNNTIKVYRRHK